MNQIAPSRLYWQAMPDDLLLRIARLISPEKRLAFLLLAHPDPLSGPRDISVLDYYTNDILLLQSVLDMIPEPEKLLEKNQYQLLWHTAEHKTGEAVGVLLNLLSQNHRSDFVREQFSFRYNDLIETAIKNLQYGSIKPLFAYFKENEIEEKLDEYLREAIKAKNKQCLVDLFSCTQNHKITLFLSKRNASGESPIKWAIKEFDADILGTIFSLIPDKKRMVDLLYPMLISFRFLRANNLKVFSQQSA